MMKKQIKYQNQEFTPPPEKRIINFFISLLKYPFRIAKRYEAHNVGLGDLMAVKNEPNKSGADDDYFKKFQKNNTKLVFLLIYGPLLIGFLISCLVVFNNRKNYVDYYQKLTSPIKEERFTKKISGYLNKIVFLIKDQPISSDDITPIFIAFIFSLAGAKFLSINPVFNIEENIKKRLAIMGCTDIEGNPWKIVWTPEAMLIVAFGEDPMKLVQDSKFWATINFPPSVPKQSKKDMNKFVVQKKYELSSNSMIFKFGDNYGRK